MGTPQEYQVGIGNQEFSPKAAAEAKIFQLQAIKDDNVDGQKHFIARELELIFGIDPHLSPEIANRLINSNQQQEHADMLDWLQKYYALIAAYGVLILIQ